ncbi:MAG TPA: hypothetical protein VLA72_17885 [Anaerolineales bacterium]|nr:hypothetical protein [Anaerolineales bacterium]
MIAVALVFYQPNFKSLYGQYFPSATPLPTSTKVPTPTPNWTATQKVIETTATAHAIQSTIADASNNWNALLSEPFNNNDNNWETELSESEWNEIYRKIDNGKYTWDATAKKGFISWIDANTISTTDFYLTVEAKQLDGTTSSDYGLIFRQDIGSNFYYFGIGDDSFFVGLSYNNEWLNIIDWTTSNAISPNGSNRLTVIASGSHFIFLINDQFAGEAIDNHIPKGTVGLAVVIHTANQQANFEFDNFELRVP